jgi:phenylacetate-CoA ligase
MAEDCVDDRLGGLPDEGAPALLGAPIIARRPRPVHADDLSRLPSYWRDRLAGAMQPSGGPPGLVAYRAQIIAGLRRMEASQWLPAEELRRRQLGQAEAVVRYAAEHSPYYRRAFAEAGVDAPAPLTEEAWRRVPLLRRRDVQSAGNDLACRSVPPLHGPVTWTKTSGSTGEPVRVAGTEATRLYYTLIALRDHAWHGRELGGRLATIRGTQGKAPGPDGVKAPTWGGRYDALVRTGPFAVLDISTDIPVQARFLAEFDPDYLSTYPTNVAALLDHAARHGLDLPRLRSVRTLGEIVSPELRRACREVWGAPVVDMYTSEEVGYLALECPLHEHLHVQCENVLLEVLDDAGVPCPPGVVGRLVVTALHNLATPLIRYDLGDLGELGPPCDCGRGLPVLARIVGRTRHLVTLPSGERWWPRVGFGAFREVAPAVRQYQIIQESLTELTARFTVDAPLSAEEEAGLTAVIRRSLRHPFAVRFEYPAVLAREKSGKYFEFKSRLEEDGSPA